MSLKPFPTIINSDLYQKTWKDILYNSMNSYLYSIGKYKTLTDKGKLLGSIGKDSSLIYEELYFYKSLINYFINARETLTKSGITNFALSKEDYKFTCIRDTIFCKYRSTKIFDDLYEISGLSKNRIDGVDFMIFDPHTGAELIVNGDFISDDGWSIGTGWNISAGVAGIATHTGSSGNLSRPISLETGSTYRLEFDIITIASGLHSIKIETSTEVFFNEIGFHTIDITIGTPTGSIVVNSNDDLVMDNISLRKLININNINDLIIG